MSKRLFTTAKWKVNSYRRQRDALRQIRRKLKTQGNPLEEVQSDRSRKKKHRRPVSTIVAPANFSVANNPEELIRFLSQLEFLSGTYNIHLDLSGVTNLTTDAVAVLVATIKKHSISSTTRITGNQPEAAAPREKLIESGFFSHVHSEQPVTNAKGRISERQSRKVEPVIAQSLIHVATNALYGNIQKSHPAYRALIECMNNTHNHASGGSELRETWWATAYADHSTGRACYSFVDIGVGIFRSVKIGKIRKALKTLGIKDDADLLRDI